MYALADLELTSVQRDCDKTRLLSFIVYASNPLTLDVILLND